MVKKITHSHVQFGHIKCVHSKQAYGCEKLTHDENRDKIVKYLRGEGLKNYNIPLPPVISRRIGKYHKDEHDSKRLCEWHFPTHIPKGEGRKREKPSRCCFVYNKIPGEILKGKRTSYWCKDCGKASCVVPCFKIYLTQTTNYMQKILGKGYCM